MSSNESDSAPDPSQLESKKVDVDSETSDEQSEKIERKQSMVGTPGYVSQLLEELDDTTEIVNNQEPAKPIRKQTLEERRASVKATEDDLKQYFTEIVQEPKKSTEKLKKSSSLLKLDKLKKSSSLLKLDKLKKSSSHLKLDEMKKSSSRLKLSALSSKEEKEELQSLPKVTPSESRPSGSEWKPFDILEEHVGVKTERSWVGTYIVGKDYWSTEEKLCKEVESSTVKCKCIDNEKKPWYDMPLRQPSTKDSSFFTQKAKSLGKIEDLQLEIEESYEDMMQQRVRSAAHARQGPRERDEFTDDFKHCFQEVARAGEFSHGGTHISMVDTDKWLEKVEILDYKHLTLIHTGLCFMASGGSRHRGLSFTEFTHFLEMISHTTGMRLKDLVGILRASQRKHSDLNTES